MQRYVERAPVAALADVVSSAWIQQVPPGARYPHRNVPHGGAELVCALGASPHAVGPLTRPRVDLLAPGTTVVGLRLRPGAAAALLGLPPAELVDLAVPVDALWGRSAASLGERMAGAASAEQALGLLQHDVLARRTADPDPLVVETVRRLMPGWGTGPGPLPALLSVSERHLRRRCQAAAGLAPKALHRTLRFQGFLARAQQALAVGRAPAGDGLATLAVLCGYADQAHLTRECLRLTGSTPRAFLDETAQQCGCGHDHAASYLPLLRSSRLAG